MDDEWSRLKAEAENAGLWLQEVEPGRKTRIWHPDCPRQMWVFVPHADAGDLHYKQLVSRAAHAKRQLGGNRPDDETVIEMHQRPEPRPDASVTERSRTRCSGKGKKD